MRTIKIAISDIEKSKFGISKDNLAFSDFVDIVSKELSRQTLEKCIALAGKYRLSKMTMEEITREVKATRRNAKNRH